MKKGVINDFLIDWILNLKVSKEIAASQNLSVYFKTKFIMRTNFRFLPQDYYSNDQPWNE